MHLDMPIYRYMFIHVDIRQRFMEPERLSDIESITCAQDSNCIYSSCWPSFHCMPGFYPWMMMHHDRPMEDSNGTRALRV